MNGRPVSVQTTGMGGPSIGIVIEELIRLGGRQLVRVGTTGALSADIGLGDMIIATSATPVDGTVATFMGGKPYAPAADFALTHALVHSAEKLGAGHHVGPIASIDVFSHYHGDSNLVSSVAGRRGSLRGDGGQRPVLSRRGEEGPGRLHGRGGRH